MKLYMRVEGAIAQAWLTTVAGTEGVDASKQPLSLAVSILFGIADKAVDRITLSVAGQVEYRAYTLLAGVENGYALVEPNLDSVRRAYPGVCRVVNINSGVETQLCSHLQEGLALLHAAAAGETVDAFV